MDLSSLLSPMSATEFVREWWERRPLRIGPARLDRVDRTLTLDDVDRLLAEGRVPPELLTFNSGGQEVSASRYCTDRSTGKGRVVRRVVLERVYELLSTGHTMVLGELQACHPALAELCNGLARDLGGRVHANVYVTPPHSQGFGAHYDTHDVFVLQLFGRKRWRLYDSPCPLPLRDQSFRRLAPTIGEVTEELVMEPGDLLYIPRGHVHEAAALDSLSVHTTLGVTAPHWSDFLGELVTVAGHDAVDLRHAVPPEHVLGPTTTAQADRVRALLRQLLAPETVVRAKANVVQRYSEPPHASARHRLVDLAAVAQLDTDAICGPRVGLAVHHDPTAGTVELVGAGVVLVLPEIMVDEIEHIASRPRFRVGDLPGDLDDEDKLRLTRKLLTAGFLRRHGHQEAVP